MKTYQSQLPAERRAISGLALAVFCICVGIAAHAVWTGPVQNLIAAQLDAEYGEAK